MNDTEKKTDVTTCWAHFGWANEQDRAKGIDRHLPHLAQTREELVERYDENETSLITKVRIVIIEVE